MASWWTAIHGHGHPVLDAAITGQLATMNHVMFGGLTHEPAVRLAQLLVQITPDGPRHVFFSDSGSVSVEVAVKMALQYWRSIGRRRQAPADDLARRLPRRHLHPDERVRPGRRHALAVDRRAGAAGVRAAGARRVRPRLQRGVREAAGRARRRAGRRDRRARGAGRGRHAVPRPAVPRPTCARSATATTCCWSSTRSPPASAAPGSCSPPSTPASAPTSCASARR